MEVVQLFLIVLILSSIITIEALLSHAQDDQVVAKVLSEVDAKCSPGKFYKRSCRQCFCDDRGRAVCSKTSNCKLVDKIPSTPDAIRTYSMEELHKLPVLAHQAVECTPGAWYRVDCNTCACLANKNLLCNGLLCPSYDDVNRIKAKSLIGKPCTSESSQECVTCTCEKNSLKCEATPECIPTGGRRDFRLTPPLDLSLLKSKKLSKPSCEPGMVYKDDCNRCYCQPDKSLRCTLMKCLKNTEVKRLKKLRLELEKEGL